MPSWEDLVIYLQLHRDQGFDYSSSDSEILEDVVGPTLHLEITLRARWLEVVVRNELLIIIIRLHFSTRFFGGQIHTICILYGEIDLSDRSNSFLCRRSNIRYQGIERFFFPHWTSHDPPMYD